MDKPLISIMLPCYNSAKTLPMALSSILTQSYDNWECIIVNDGSNDETESIVNLIKDERIQYHTFGKNCGRGIARQFALDKSNGKYIAMIDADDWWYPCKLDKQMRALDDNSDIEMLSCGIAVFDSANNIISLRVFNSENELLIQNGTAKILQRSPFPFPSSIVNALTAKKTGFDAKLFRVQDYDFIIRGCIGAKYGIMSDILYAYFQGNGLVKRERIINLKCRLIMLRKFKSKYPQIFLKEFFKTFAKYVFVTLMPEKPLKNIFDEKKKILPETEIENFLKAKTIIHKFMNNHFDKYIYI